jgi:DNA polymerase IV (DinB-like DNA polymerase)
LQKRVILLVDLDYFFAQCEELRNPSIKDKPVVICVYSGRSEDSGVVSTANYVARNYGVRSGMPIFLAKKKLASIEAIFLPVDFTLYDEISKKVMDTLRSFADRFEQAGIDEAYLDVTERIDGNFERAGKLAGEIKNEMRIRQGLTCSIGVGPNKLVAKIAADSKKPDGLTVVEPEQVESFLSPLPVNRLVGVGAKTKERMQTLGINTIFDLANYDVQKLIAVFGRTSATYFHNASLGRDDEPVAERGEAEAISRIATLRQDSHDLTYVLEKTGNLCQEIHLVIVQGRMTFKTVGIIVITTDMSIHTRSKTLETATNDPDIMKKTVKELLERFLNENGMEARRVGVKVSNLIREEKYQKQLTSFIEKKKG